MRPLGAHHEAISAGRGGPATATARRTRGSSGGCDCTWCEPAGLPATFALANPKLDKREVAIDMFDHDPSLLAGRAGQTIIANKGYVSAEFERILTDRSVEPARPARKHERPRRGARQLKSLRQIIESFNDTLKGQLSLEQHTPTSNASSIVALTSNRPARRRSSA